MCARLNAYVRKQSTMRGNKLENKDGSQRLTHKKYNKCDGWPAPLALLREEWFANQESTNWYVDNLLTRSLNRVWIRWIPFSKTCDGADDPPSTKPSKSADTFLQPPNEQVGCKTCNPEQDDGFQPLSSKVIGTRIRKHPTCW